MPAISPDSLYGAVHLAGDGHLDPHGATHAVADAARALGVRIRTGVRVTGFELSARREITAVLTDAGPIATEIVVNAAGIWAPQVAAMVGAFIPSTPVDHQHIALKAVPGSELPREMPCFRDPDNLVYGKSEHGGMVFGGYELDPRSRWEDGVPWEHAAQSLPADYERFAPLMAGAIRRFPFLADAEAIRLVCHPDAMTPDANPLLGPLPGVRGFWVAAGLSLNGFGGGGGIGRAMAGWITAGDPGVDIGPYRAWRFSDTYRDPGFAAGLARETYSDYYRLRYPYDADLAGRPRRLSALHGRLQEAGAVFGTKAGWERADYHDPVGGWRRAGRDQAGYGWTRPPWFERVCAEARAVRERSGVVDLSSFGKIAVEGPGALGLLQRVSANDVDRPVGAVTYTPVVRRARRDGGRRDRHAPRGRQVPSRDRRGLSRLGDGLAANPHRRRRGRLDPRRQRRSRDDRAVGAAGTGRGGRRGRLGRRGRQRRHPRPSRGVHPHRSAPVHAARISYAGELGWELTTPSNGPSPSGIASAPPAPNPSAIEPSTPSAWRRATATTAPTSRCSTPRSKPVSAPSSGSRRARSSGATRSPRPTPPARTAASEPSPSAAPTTNPSTAARQSASTARSSVASAASPTARPSSGRSVTPTCRRRAHEGTELEIDVFDRRVSAVIGPDVLVDARGERMRA